MTDIVDMPSNFSIIVIRAATALDRTRFSSIVDKSAIRELSDTLKGITKNLDDKRIRMEPFPDGFWRLMDHVWCAWRNEEQSYSASIIVCRIKMMAACIESAFGSLDVSQVNEAMDLCLHMSRAIISKRRQQIRR